MKTFSSLPGLEGYRKNLGSELDAIKKKISSDFNIGDRNSGDRNSGGKSGLPRGPTQLPLRLGRRSEVGRRILLLVVRRMTVHRFLRGLLFQIMRHKRSMHAIKMLSFLPSDHTSLVPYDLSKFSSPGGTLHSHVCELLLLRQQHTRG